MLSFVEFLHALAHETRWRMVEMLLMQPLCICELMGVLDLPQSTVSSQVQALRRAGVLVSRRSGRNVLLHVSDEHRPLLLSLRDHLGVSARVNGALLRDAKRARRLVAARPR